MCVHPRVYWVCVHECWWLREAGGLGSFVAEVTGGCGMCIVSRIANAVQPPVFFFFDMHKMSALSHNENMISYVCCLSGV